MTNGKVDRYFRPYVYYCTCLILRLWYLYFDHLFTGAMCSWSGVPHLIIILLESIMYEHVIYVR